MPLLLYLVCLSAAQPPDTGALQRYSQEGQRALAERRYDDAAKAYEKLRELSPGTAEVHAGLGLIYFQQQRFSEAVPALRQALKLNPALPRADILLAMSLSELGQFKEALPGLRKGFRQTSDVPLRRSSGLQLQRAYTGLRQDDKAVEVALELSRLHPDDPEVLYHSGRLFGNYAYLQTMKLWRVAPTSVWMHQAAGEANESQGLYDQAVREYRQVLELDPRRPGIHFRIGRALLARALQPGAGAEAGKAREEAFGAFEAELKVDPSNANAAYELGEMHRKAGELDVAAAFFESAVSRYPDFAEARLGLGRVLVAQGQPERALPHLQKAVALDPANDVAHYQLSVALGKLGNVAEQRKVLEEFQRLRERKREREALLLAPPSPVTPQELDPSAPPPP
jgi:tetratricopeptide (TPR) repeat protein